MADPQTNKLAVVNLNAWATISIPHGLKTGKRGVVPTRIDEKTPQTPILVTGFDTMFVTFTNASDVMASADFRVEYDPEFDAG